METKDVAGMQTSDGESHQNAEMTEPLPDNHHSGPDPPVSSSSFNPADEGEEMMSSQTLTGPSDGGGSVTNNSAVNALDDGGVKERESAFGTIPPCRSDENLSSQTESPEKMTTRRPMQEEDTALTCHLTDNNPYSSPHNNNNSNKSDSNSLSKSSSDNIHHNDQHVHPSRKHVAWQTDCEVRAGLATACSDHFTDRVNVEPGGRADPQSPGASCSLTPRNKGFTELEHDIHAAKNENILSQGEIKEKDLRLTAQRNNEIKDLSDTHSCLGDSHNTFLTANTQGREATEVDVRPNLLVRRRPASASGLTGRQAHGWGDKAFSQDSFGPFRAGPSRRLSLPLYNSQHVSNDNSHRPGCREQVNKQQSSDLLNALAQEVEKETKRAVLVTYSKQEETQSPDTPTDSASEADTSSRPPPSGSTEKPRCRPQTAGPARAPGVRGTGRMIHSAPPRMAPLRPWELKFTKEELQRALPRRNFFSCHNRALKDAGFQVEEENARPRRRRLLFFHHDDSPAATPPAIHEPPTKEEKEDRREDDNAINVHSDNSLETAVQMLSLHERAKSKRRKSQAVQVECKPLQLYLSYVADNPGEYRHMVAKSSTSGFSAALHPSSHPGDNCHTARLVSMGRIFQERHGGRQRADEVLRAVYSLNPRDADPNRFAKPARDKSPLMPGLISRKQSSLTNFPRKESAVSSHSGAGEEGSKSGQRSKPGSEMAPKHEMDRLAQMEHLTEVEKRRLKAEEWARTVTTEQLVRAKLQVLKELGHEEQELSQWWLAFRTCLYLRPRIRE